MEKNSLQHPIQEVSLSTALAGTDFRTYPALLNAIKAYARNLRDSSNGKRSAQWSIGNGLLAWANAYAVAGPRPIERDYPPMTHENAVEIGEQMKAHRVALADWYELAGDAYGSAK